MSSFPLTSTLNLALTGDAVAAERAWTEVYGEVRGIAAAAITREAAAGAPHADLTPTGLVHEIFIRLGRNPPHAWDSRRHFFGSVRHAGDQVLVDQSRMRAARKRGGGKAPIPLTFVASELAQNAPSQTPTEIGLPNALQELAREYPRAAEVARLRYVEGLPTATVAGILGVSESTVEKDWAFARAWLRRRLDRETGDGLHHHDEPGGEG
jgi:RNA polymerase sigma factor (TIGR02999 family)